MASAEPALQAACKVRTEVLEVTRSMHDRTNAHFMLWPLCVEVQRCSGCCNSRTSQCVPVVTETRQLQMTKITYVNMRAHFEKVIIPVEDHVRCSCQPLTSPHAGRTSTARKPQATPPPPPAPRVAHKPPQPHGHTKEDLHRHDQLKQTQRLHLDERLGQERLWQNKYSPSHTAGEPPHHTPARRMDYQAPPHHHTTTTPRQHPGGGGRRSGGGAGGRTDAAWSSAVPRRRRTSGGREDADAPARQRRRQQQTGAGWGAASVPPAASAAASASAPAAAAASVPAAAAAASAARRQAHGGRAAEASAHTVRRAHAAGRHHASPATTRTALPPRPTRRSRLPPQPIRHGRSAACPTRRE
ncbi:serine/arginine repetitive matrix protein 1 isoform X2 [Alosa sapidissima]|nr:serine/arginine repetitive matrix protein 1 isoform X2 [Alosa sapidissima]